ncbi:hypothetical protein [Azospirillum sp. Marseille-Q6669]
MSLGTAIDAELATTASLEAHTNLYRAAALGGDAEALRRARVNCEAALDARLDAIDVVTKEQRKHRRGLGL